jgi:opacity protein-like surface antigen
MNKLSLLATSTLLAFSSAAFAEGFYFQAGGGAGFVSGGINQAGIRDSETTWMVQTPVINDSTATTGAWFVGLGYMFNKSFGLESNYFGYSNTSTHKTQTENALARRYEMSTDVYQVNLLGVARTPLEVGWGFFVKAKAGLAWTDEQQNMSASDNVGMITYLKNDQSERKFSPVLGIGLENDVTDLVSISIEYLAAINNQVENSTVFLAVKFNPFDVVNALGY